MQTNNSDDNVNEQNDQEPKSFEHGGNRSNQCIDPPCNSDAQRVQSSSANGVIKIPLIAPRVNLPDLASVALLSKLVEQMSNVMKAMTSVYTFPAIDAMRSLSSTFADMNKRLIDSATYAQEALEGLITKIDFSGLSKLAETVSEEHLPHNWPGDNKRQYVDLCSQGLPIVFVPRVGIVEQMAQKKDVPAIKRFIVGKRISLQIIEDCEAAIFFSDWLASDMRDHILSSIDCYKAGNYRAAQSTACIAFDCLLEEIVNMRAIRMASGNVRQSHYKMISKKITNNQVFNDIMNLPPSPSPFYSVLMFPIIGHMLIDFTVDDKATYTNDPSRHMTTHTVSSIQYKPSNALLIIMVIACICEATQLEGKYWMQRAAESYGVTLP